MQWTDSEVRSLECSATVSEHTNFVSAICISGGTNPYVASSSWDCTISIHDFHSKEKITTILNPVGVIISDLDVNTRFQIQDIVASFSLDGKIRVYDALQDFVCIYCFDHSTAGECSVMGAVRLAYFDRPYCVSGGVDKVVRITDLSYCNEPLKVLRGHTGGVKCLDVSEKGMVASGSNDNNIKLWDIFTGKFIRTLRGHSLEVNALNFIVNSTWLVSGSEDNLFRVWDAENGERLRIFKGHMGSSVTSIASIYMPGKIPPMAIIGGTEKESYRSQLLNPLEVWRLDNPQCLIQCSGHRDEVAALAVHCTTTETHIACQIVSGGVDKVLRFWDVSDFLEAYTAAIEADESVDESESTSQIKDNFENHSVFSDITKL